MPADLGGNTDGTGTPCVLAKCRGCEGVRPGRVVDGRDQPTWLVRGLAQPRRFGAAARCETSLLGKLELDTPIAAHLRFRGTADQRLIFAETGRH